MVGELHKFGMGPTHITVLGRAELGDIGLVSKQAGISYGIIGTQSKGQTYVDVETQDWVFLSRPLQTSDFCLDLIDGGWGP